MARVLVQWQRRLLVSRCLMTLKGALSILALAALAAPRHAFAQEALVTFYNQGSQLAPFAPVSKNGIFNGWVWDGNVLLASFQESKWQAHSNRFITLHLPAGTHEFSLADGKHPAKKGRVPVLLAPGKHYYFRTRIESWNAVLIADFKAKLDTVTCKEAIVEARSAQPLKPKEPPPNLTLIRVDDLSFPSNCDDAAVVTPTFPDPNEPAR